MPKENLCGKANEDISFRGKDTRCYDLISTNILDFLLKMLIDTGCKRVVNNPRYFVVAALFFS